MPKYSNFLTPAEYDKLTIDEKAEYIADMAALLKRRVPASDPPPDATNPAQDDPPPPDSANQPQKDPTPPGATNEPQEDPPLPDATNQPQEDPPRSDEKPKEP